MDILISSNLERLLYFFTGAGQTRGYLKALSEHGRYEIEPEDLARIREYFDGGSTDEEGTAARIKATWEESGRLIDTHTSVAADCAKRLGKPGEKIVVVSTASPYKFAADVTRSLGGSVKYDRGVLSPLYSLSELTKTKIPAPLAALAAIAVAPQNHVAFVDPFRIVIELIACHIAPGPVPSVCLPTAAPQPAQYKERRPIWTPLSAY